MLPEAFNLIRGIPKILVINMYKRNNTNTLRYKWNTNTFFSTEFQVPLHGDLEILKFC